MGVNKVPSITGRFSFGRKGNNFSFIRGQKMKRKGGLTASVAGGNESSYVRAFVYFYLFINLLIHPFIQQIFIGHLLKRVLAGDKIHVV